MSVEAQRLALQAWLSPAFPTGGFSYSQGLESAVSEGWVTDGAGLRLWLETVIGRGAGRADCIIFGAAYRHRAAATSVDAVNELALALASGKERHLETSQQGASFRLAYLDAWSVAGAAPWPAGPLAYPVAAALAAADHAIALHEGATAFLNASAINLISAAIRLGVIGQVEGQKLLATLQPVICGTALEASEAGLDGLGSAAAGVDLASILHETQYSRLFRS
jgi:urease accessory protein